MPAYSGRVSSTCPSPLRASKAQVQATPLAGIQSELTTDEDIRARKSRRARASSKRPWHGRQDGWPRRSASSRYRGRYPIRRHSCPAPGMRSSSPKKSCRTAAKARGRRPQCKSSRSCAIAGTAWPRRWRSARMAFPRTRGDPRPYAWAHRHQKRKRRPPCGDRRSGLSTEAGSGGRIRTCDLRVMSPTSCQTAPPRIRVREF